MPDHPHCRICNVPMWLVKVELGDIADRQSFQCQVCEQHVVRVVPHLLEAA